MDDEIDLIGNLEDEAFQQGKLDGFKEGLVRAVSDGYEFALSEGTTLGDELAYYTALCHMALVWTSKEGDPITSSSTARTRERIRRSALQLQKWISAFPIFRNATAADDVAELLQKIRAKSKLLSASLHLGHINIKMGLPETNPSTDKVEERSSDPSTEEISYSDLLLDS